MRCLLFLDGILQFFEFLWQIICFLKHQSFVPWQAMAGYLFQEAVQSFEIFLVFQEFRSRFLQSIDIRQYKCCRTLGSHFSRGVYRSTVPLAGVSWSTPSAQYSTDCECAARIQWAREHALLFCFSVILAYTAIFATAMARVVNG